MQSPGGCESSVEDGLEKTRRTHESVSRGIYMMSTIGRWQKEIMVPVVQPVLL